MADSDDSYETDNANELAGINRDTTSSHNNYKWFVLFVLTLVNALNFFDRQLIVILQEPIKVDLNLSDTQLGLLTGLSFAIFYSIMGIPIARFADRGNRKKVISAAMAVWSIFTALTGYVQGFFQMLLVRIGVGVGETGSGPAALSIIADYFPLEKRGRAFAIYSMGLYVGLFLSFILAGYLVEAWGWRSTFIYLGLPGVAFAIILLLVVKEPSRGLSETKEFVQERKGLSETFQFLFTRKTFIYICIGNAMHSFVGYSFANWMPSFFIRVHKMPLSEVGLWLAISIGIGGAMGAFIGGIFTDRMVKLDRRWYMWLAIGSIFITLPFALFTLLSSNAIAAVICYFIPNFFYSFTMGAMLTVILGVVKVDMRALTGAIYFFVINLVGLGLGPLTVGMLSDYLQPQFDSESLRYSLLFISIFNFVAIYFYWKASHYLEEELDAV